MAITNTLIGKIKYENLRDMNSLHLGIKEQLV